MSAGMITTIGDMVCLSFRLLLLMQVKVSVFAAALFYSFSAANA